MIGIIAVVVASIFFLGVVNRTKAIASGRKGPGLLQHMYDIVRLLRKQTIYSTTTGFVFKIAPSIYFSSIVCALLVLPFHDQQAVISFDGDFVFFAYMLAVGRFFMIIAAMDTGSPFEGMGANREALYALLAEPAFFLLMGSFAMYTGTTSFADMFNDFINYSDSTSIFLLILAFFLLFQIMMIENSRLPLDDPNTHLELTMIHEVMILDNSAFDMAILTYSVSLKFAMFGLLMCNFLLHSGMNIVQELLLFFGLQFALAVTVGMAESFRARERMKKNPNFIFILTVLALILFFGIVLIMNKL
ncbi:MAG: NADH-quinone oxidoreductase subunit H [Cytophagales bacterium]|nr:NADH-quinone oxidoreductase subunit H [Cytophagales bacterium]